MISDSVVKRQIRSAAEDEERDTYAHRHRSSGSMLLLRWFTDWRSHFLESAPYLIVVFSRRLRVILESPMGATTNANTYWYCCGV